MAGKLIYQEKANFLLAYTSLTFEDVTHLEYNFMKSAKKCLSNSRPDEGGKMPYALKYHIWGWGGKSYKIVYM